MNDNKRDTGKIKFARQAIDGFVQTPNPGVQSRNRLGAPNKLQPGQLRARKSVINERLRSNLRTTSTPMSMDGITVAPRASQQPRPTRARPERREDSVLDSKPVETQDKPQEAKSQSAIRRGKPKTGRRTWRTYAKRGALATFLVTFALAGLLATKGYLKLNQIFKGGGAAAAMDANVDPSKLRGEGDGRVNILLLGRGGAGHDGPDLTDTILVASIDPVNKKTALVSVPRDLWVESKNGNSKLNAVFANAKSAALYRGSSNEAAEKAGLQAIEKSIEKVLGIDTHYYSLIDFKGFEKAVNTVGGVTINAPEELRDGTMAWENNWNPVLAKKGKQDMKGKQALMYVRSRHGSARGDFDRSERQRIFIMSLKNEILSSNTFSNPVKISRLMDDFGDHAKTDFSMGDLTRLRAITKDIHDNNVKSIGLADPPHDYVTTGTYAGQSIVQPKAGIFDYSEIHTYIRSQLPDGYIIKEKAPITILNGTETEGVATKIANDLKSYSYNVKKVDNAPTQNYRKTVIVDLTGKNKYTKNYLEKRFKTKVTRSIPEEISIPEQERKGFVIIIGRNETDN